VNSAELFSRLPIDSKWNPEIGEFCVHFASKSELLSFECEMIGFSRDVYRFYSYGTWERLDELPEYIYNSLGRIYCFASNGRELFDSIDFQNVLMTLEECDILSNVRWKIGKSASGSSIFSLCQIRALSGAWQIRQFGSWLLI